MHRLIKRFKGSTIEPHEIRHDRGPEFKKIEQAYRESIAYHVDTRRVVIKQLLFSQWSEVMVEICKEMPTALHVGCHAHEGGGLELFRQTVKPSQILPEIISWNRVNLYFVCKTIRVTVNQAI